MKCPSCGHPDSRVIDSRGAHEGEAIRRRRECEKCGRRFTTYERIEERPPVVVKKNGSRVPYNREKVMESISIACRKRDIPMEKLEAVVDRLEREFSERAGGEITTDEIGAGIMGALRGLDQVAYVRFASVYREFRDIDQFLEEVKSMRKDGE